jgi:hypothetical protein
MIEAILSRLIVATQQLGENMTCRLSTRMAKLGDSLAESSGEELYLNAPIY